jgi:pilus assembly protein CpaE
MFFSKLSKSKSVAQVTVVSRDPELVRSLGPSLAARGLALTAIDRSLDEAEARIDTSPGTVLLVDLDVRRGVEITALQKLMARAVHNCPVLVVTSRFDEKIGRQLLHLKITDHFLKPVQAEDLVQALVTASQSSEIVAGDRRSTIITFMPVGGGVGCTSLAIEAAVLATERKGRKATACIVDLNLQNGAVAGYLDVAPGLVAHEIEPHPERLDAQMLGVMTSRHASGIGVIATPRLPATDWTMSDRAVTAILDQAAGVYETVVIDHPTTWQTWTDAVVLGSDQLFLVTQLTVPGLRATESLLHHLTRRFGDRVAPKVLVNRFKTSLFSSGTRKSDALKVLGGAVAGFIPNDYELVQEAIDRGVPLREVKPGNKISKELRAAVFGNTP